MASPYRRYALTPDGVSPRLLPGASEHLVIADSDEHDQEGHITEDLTIRVEMVNKRMKKLDGLKREVIAPSYVGDASPDLLLISWGSTQGSVLEAAARLRANGRTVATLHFAQVWPLVAEQFIDFLRGARQVVSIESNFTGQFARLILRETGIMITRQVLRYDGLPITPQYILRELNA